MECAAWHIHSMQYMNVIVCKKEWELQQDERGDVEDIHTIMWLLRKKEEPKIVVDVEGIEKNM